MDNLQVNFGKAHQNAPVGQHFVSLKVKNVLLYPTFVSYKYINRFKVKFVITLFYNSNLSINILRHIDSVPILHTHHAYVKYLDVSQILKQKFIILAIYLIQFCLHYWK